MTALVEKANQKKKQRVLVYPCGTEIALEIHKAAEFSTHFELWGGSSNYDHGRYVYKRHLDNLPFISDDSTEDEVKTFRKEIERYDIDYIYPATDGVLYKFSQYRSVFDSKIIAPDFNTAKIIRSKKLTYQLLDRHIATPKIYKIDEVEYPAFIKPDVGQDSTRTKKIDSKNILENISLKGMLLMEYLPGDEYTVDCFTNNNGALVYASARCGKRVKNGISVSSGGVSDSKFYEMADKINHYLEQRGGWFFQVKENNYGKLVLLEVASRIAGASAYARSKGINLPLLTMYLYAGHEIASVIENKYDVVIDRALYNSYSTNLHYDKVYVDYDDTVIFDNKVNIQLISFLYQCVNNKIPIVLITKHSGDIFKSLEKYRLQNIFDEVIHIKPGENKYTHINEANAIFIDDSFGERSQVSENCAIPVFDSHMVEVLLNPLAVE